MHTDLQALWLTIWMCSKAQRESDFNWDLFLYDRIKTGWQIALNKNCIIQCVTTIIWANITQTYCKTKLNEPSQVSLNHLTTITVSRDRSLTPESISVFKSSDQGSFLAFHSKWPVLGVLMSSIIIINFSVKRCRKIKENIFLSNWE